ncbi:hypothetical protein L3Q82_009532 [Scortum barcoo]|uniref:Uncharacterized protein n=1 Tax=Scortum barcoo TaxID=214431 RepID=A0ACB8WGH9_9TELE|nr:hypothetical protein L3Q82_009532 [Scortum barcoo]
MAWPVERVSSFKFLGTHISENLSWTTNTSSLIKKAHQRLPEDTEEEPPVHCHPRQLLPVCDREYPNQLHHSLVWELLCHGPQGTAEGVSPRKDKITTYPKSEAMDEQGSAASAEGA